MILLPMLVLSCNPIPRGVAPQQSSINLQTASAKVYHYFDMAK